MNDLLKLTRRQKELLRLRVRKWNGLVRIFVHPMFEKWHFPYTEYVKDPDYGRWVKIEKGLSRLITLPEEKTPPIIIMEENYRVENLMNWIDSNSSGMVQRDVYYVRTLKNTSHPLVVPRLYYDIRLQWEKLSRLLRSIGCKKILIGGLKFTAATYKDDWTGKKPWVAYCVGIAISYLSNDKAGKFDVDISALVDCQYSRNVYIQCVNETRLNRKSHAPAYP